MKSTPARRKLFGIKPPTQLAVRLEALFKLHPRKTRNEVLCNVLNMGMAELEAQSASNVPAPGEIQYDVHSAVYLLSGPFSEFHKLEQKHHYEREQAMDKTYGGPLPAHNAYSLGDAD